MKNDALDSLIFANEMMLRAKEQYKQVEAQREEIITAFIAKYGFKPDEVIQIYGRTDNGSQTYQVIHVPKHQVEAARKLWIMSKVSKKPLTRWERFCVWMAALPRRYANKNN